MLRTFDSLEEASAALDALHAAGLPHGMAQVRVLQDEAGPGSGNFVIGNGQTTHGGAPGAVRTGLEVPYDENFREPAWRAGHLLMVAPENDAQARIAREVLDRLGGLAVESAAAQGDSAAH
jgi:hypothetical protein